MEAFKIWCETKEELNKVLQKMENESIVWYSGHLPTKWQYIPAPVALSVRKGKLGLLPFSKAGFDKYSDPITITPEEYLNERRTEMKLKDVKPGMVVEYASGMKRLVVSFYNETDYFLIGEDGYHRLSNYSEDLKEKDLDLQELNIVKIYRSIYKGRWSNLMDKSNLQLIWEREPDAKEMTIKELEELLGYSVKIVKEK